MSGKVDMSELKKFREQLNNVNQGELRRKVANDLGRRFYNLIIREGAPTYHPYDTGFLKSKWKVERSHDVGSTAVVDISNNVKYASYVEYGHRIRNSNRMVAGRFMMTRTVQYLQERADGIAKKVTEDYLREKLNGK